MTVNAIQRGGEAGASGSPQGYIVRSGDTLSDIAQRHGVSLPALIRANPQILHPDLIRPGQHVSIPGGSAASGGTYTVRSGDTLSEIGARHGVSWQSIAQANHLANPDLILPGQKLTIPGGSGGSRDVGGVGGSLNANANANANTGAGQTAPSRGGSSDRVAQIAAKYLGQSASSLKVNTSDNLPMSTNVPSTVCCANFVSAVLAEAGQLPANLRTNSVSQLNATLRAQGWTEVPASRARPGDVVIIKGGGVSHTELIAGPGKMIGSNNVNSDGTQRISYDNLSWALSKGAVILRAP